MMNMMRTVARFRPPRHGDLRRQLTSYAGRFTSATASVNPGSQTESLRQQLADHRPFFLQLVDAAVDFAAAEFIDRQAGHDLERLAVAAHRERRDQSLFNSITAVGTHTHAVPVARRRGFDDG